MVVGHRNQGADVLTRFVVGVAVVFGMAGGVWAQVSSPENADTEQIKARQRIFMLEGVLERAVQLGVDNLGRRVRAVMPDDTLLQGGMPVVRGFRLDGYGIFFDVEVPALRRSLAWSLRTMNQTGMALARDLAQMRAFVQAIADPSVRAEFDRTLLRIQQQVGPTPLPANRVVPQGQVVAAQSVPPAAGRPVARQSGPAAVQPQIDPLLLNDPSGAYTQEVKAAILDAMVENGGSLVLGDDEWLTIAARDDAPSDPFMTGDPDATTLVLRVKGGDVNAFRAGRLTLDEVRSLVQIDEF
jgi:hypothetical protein